MIAVGAVVNQGTGDPYSAFARIAAMIAVVTGVLSIAGIAFGGGGSSIAAAPPKTGDTNVLGGSYQQVSESLTHSFDAVEESLDNIFNVEDVKLTKIYNELRNLNDNITGLVSSIFRTGGLATDYTGIKTGFTPTDLVTKSREIFMAGDVIRSAHKEFGDMVGIKDLEIWADPISYAVNNLLGDLVSKVAGGLFGGGTEVKLSKGGIEFADVLVKSVLDGMSVSARQFARYKITKDGGWFGSDDVSYKTKYAALDDDVIRMLTKVFDNLGGSLVELSKSLGTDVQAVYNYVFETTQLNLKRHGRRGNVQGVVRVFFEDCRHRRV